MADSTCTGSSTPGQCEYQALSSLLTSNLAYGFAMLVAAYGCYLWLVKQNTKSGLILIIVAAAISLTAPLLDGLRANFCPAITMLGGTCDTNLKFSTTTTGQ